MGKHRHNGSADPTIKIQMDLENSIAKAAGLSERLQRKDLNRQQREWCETEARKLLRGIIWDVDDYAHTLGVISREPERYFLSQEDVLIRKEFLESTRLFVQDLSTSIRFAGAEGVHNTRFTMASGSGYRYSRLNESDQDGESSGTGGFEEILMKQDRIMRDQDEDLELVGKSVSTLKNMSYKIGDELEQQSIMLDDLGHEMERVDSRLEGVMKKIQKLAHLDDDKGQWKMIFILTGVLIFLIILLIM